MANKYLDLSGLAKFLENVTNRFEHLLSGKADKVHAHDDRYYTESEIDSRLSEKSNVNHNHDSVYAKSYHTHSTSSITSGSLPIAHGGTGQTSANGIRNAIGINPVTTGGNGSAYTASVDGISSLTSGVWFIMVPHTASTTTAPTLNVNGLGAKTIRRRVSNSTVTTVAASSSNWLGANKPIKVMYDGSFWIADFDRPNAVDIYGTISSSQIANGAITLDKLASSIGTVAIQSAEPSDSSIKIWVQTD